MEANGYNPASDEVMDYAVADWLAIPTGEKFDAVITNPPFMQSGMQNRFSKGGGFLCSTQREYEN